MNKGHNRPHGIFKLKKPTENKGNDQCCCDKKGDAHIENGKETVKIQTLLKVLKALNISIEVNSPIMKNYKGNKNEKS